MKNKEKSALIMVTLLGIVLCIVVYMYVYSAYNKKTDELKAQNATLQARINELEQYYLNRENYKKGIEEMTKDIQVKLDVFPADTKSEDALALALAAWDNWVLVQYKSIAIDSKESVGTIDAETMKIAAIEGLDQTISFYNRKVAYDNLTTYAELKELINTFNAVGEKASLDSVSYTTDTETGLLDGVIQVSFHSASGTGKKYERPEFVEYQKGLLSLFVETVDSEAVEGLSNGLQAPEVEE